MLCWVSINGMPMRVKHSGDPILFMLGLGKLDNNIVVAKYATIHEILHGIS